jgi:hypothetical protein
VNLAVMTSIDPITKEFEEYYYPESLDTVKYIYKDIFICIIKELCSDQDESKQKC